MGSLTDKLTDDSNRKGVVKACVDLVESEVSSKRGFSGAAVKAGYAVLKRLKPGIVYGAVDTMLPEFADAMQPIFDKSTDGASDAREAFTGYLEKNAAETADALLGVTDARARKTKHSSLKKTYERLRGTARDNVMAAVPGLAKALGPFI